MSLERVKVGVIGTGFGAEVQVPVFQSCPDAEVVAICSRRQERVEEAARRFNIPYPFTDWRRMLELDHIQVVSVVAPPYLHHEMTVAALDAGKHVLCEKPMAMDLRQAQEMHRRAEESGRLHMIDFEFRFVPARARMKELVAQGYLGQLYQVNIARFTWGFRTGPPDRPWNWFSEREKGGGALQAVGSHYIDALRWWFGEMTSVCAQQEILIRERRLPGSQETRPVDTEEAFAFMVRFKNGALGTVTVNSMAWQGSGERIEAYGSHGTLVIGTDGRLWASRTGQGELQVCSLPPMIPPFPVKGEEMHRAFSFIVAELVRGLRENRNASPSFDDGVKCQEVMDAVRRSTARSAWVNLPLAK